MRSREDEMKKPNRKLIKENKQPQDAVLTLELLLKAVPALYPKDRSAPGLVLSFLPSGKFYGSVARYEGEMGTGKQILFTVQEDSLSALVTELATGLLSKTDPVEKLARNIRRRVKA